MKHPDSNRTAYQRLASSLYPVLIPQAGQSLLATKSHWLIMPDGMLNYLPFEALLTSVSGSEQATGFHELPYLLHEHTIQYAYSATWLQHHKRTVSRPIQYLGVAPAYQLDALSQLENLIAFRAFRANPSPLTGNLREVEQ